MPQSISRSPQPETQARTTILGNKRISWATASGAFLLIVSFFASDVAAWSWMNESWLTSADNSHGLLVPFFSAWLLWFRKDLLASTPKIGWSSVLIGVSLILFAFATRCGGIYMRMITVQAASILPCVAGIVFLCGGWPAFHWAWPSVLFLAFMIPLPSSFGGVLSSQLQSIATICSTYLLQTLGIAAISEGNIIYLTKSTLGVAEACSGIRMLTTFFALTTAVNLVCESPAWEKCVTVLSAPVIAIIANVLRITATAIAYEFGNEKIAEMIFHDLAGWLMMPTGLLILWVESLVLAKLFEKVDRKQLQIGTVMASM